MFNRGASIATVLGLACASVSWAQTPEKQKPQILPKTVVIRVNKENNKIEFFESKIALKPVEDPKIGENAFKNVEVKTRAAKHELDRDSSTNSGFYYGGYYGGSYYWNFNYYYPSYYYPAYYPAYSAYPYYYYSPTYYYGGYSYFYRPYYCYSYGPYNYYYYGYPY